MKHAVIGALATGTAAAAAAYWWLRRQGPRLYLFAGSYTQPRQADPFEAQGGVPHDETTAGEGIYLVELDASGAFRSRGVVTTGIKNPSYVCPVPAKAPRVLYAVSESDAAEAQIVALAVERRPLGARLRLLNARRTEGGHPCMVAEHRGIVITCNYSGGSFSCFEKRPPSGELSPLIQLIQHEGSSVDASRQEAAHAHSAVFTDLHGGYMYACDLGSDTVVTYQLQPANGGGGGGAYSFKAVSRYDAPAGWGPRHLALHPTRELALLMCEMSARVILLRLHADGSLTPFEHPAPALLPDEWPGDDPLRTFNEGRWGADVCWGADGRFAYASLRLINAIVVLKLCAPREGEAEGGGQTELQLVQRLPSGGVTPRNMALSPGGELLVVGHQHSHSLVSFRVDKESGKLTSTGKAAHVPCVSCVKFVQL